ncbi:MAG TPA: ATP synthase F1 subunit delta [Vicinamibacterales bacterium]|nr:ATP synthase F1 subunit delta [Vicinamibacterales bacterium]
MTNHAAAVRYARALLDVSIAESDPELVERQFGGFVALVEANPQLREVLISPAIPAVRKQAVITALLARVPVAPVLGKLLQLLAGRDRLVLLPDLLAAYRDRVLEHRKVVRVEVTTAVGLPADRTQALVERLRTVAGRDVQLATRIDPAIIGGVVARIGSTVYDGSVTRQLARLQARLVGES